MVSCNASTRLLVRAADSVLDPEELDQLREHLWQCGKCRKEVERQFTVKQVLAEREDAALPRGFGERLAARLDTAVTPQSFGDAHPVAAPVGTPVVTKWLDLLNWRKWSIGLLPVAVVLAILVLIAERPSDSGAPLDFTTAVAGWSFPDGVVTSLVTRPDVSDESVLFVMLVRASDQAPTEEP